MMVVIKTILLFQFIVVLVEGLIPTLSVQKIDRKVIAQKRQGTLELCRMFNAENHKSTSTPESNSIFKYNKRLKRDTKGETIGGDALRVERIVEKLYDEMQENGQRVTYRQKNISMTTVKATKKPQRRFDFAPSLLSGPLAYEEILDATVPPANTSIPWHKKWRRGIIPYFIDPKTYDTYLAESITKAFDYFEKATCIRLQRLKERPKKYETHLPDWLYISNPNGIRQCVHSNEYKNVGHPRIQMVVFGYDCMSRGEIVHEVMHVLGFSHEHTRQDRDHHVTVLWDNIKPGYKKYFQTRKEDVLLSLPYDYESVLHYPPRAFSKNGQVTLLAESGVKFGQRDGLSNMDVNKVGMIFGDECLERNKDYLVSTCPMAVKPVPDKIVIDQKEIENYFKDRLWPYGIVNYMLQDTIEFTIEERENIDAVMRHIEKETCIEFRLLSSANVTANDNTDADFNNEEINADPNAVNTENYNVQVNAVNNNDGPVYQNENDGKINSKESENQQVVAKVKIHDVLNEESQQAYKEIIDNVIEEHKSDIRMSITNQTKGQLNITKGNIKTITSKAHKLPSPVNMTSSETDRKGPSYKVKLFKKEEAIRKMAQTGRPRSKRVRRSVPVSPSRRHATNILILTKSTESSCVCPPPGRPNAEKKLAINVECFDSVNNLLHLFVHVLGLDHQHNMFDRDSFLYVDWSKVTPAFKEEMKNKLPPAASAGFAYDYQSVMHYPWLQIDYGMSIMYPIWNDGWVMGRWQGLSSIDVQKLNLLYFEQCQTRKKYAAESLK